MLFRDVPDKNDPSLLLQKYACQTKTVGYSINRLLIRTCDIAVASLAVLYSSVDVVKIVMSC